MGEQATEYPPPKCGRCDDNGWVWRTPDGFNPFKAGGFATANAMFKTPCICGQPFRRPGDTP